jgi:DNA-binding YbaB/EbfC family protein
MGKVQEMQERFKQAQEKLTHLTATGEAGAGMVKATVNGNRKIIRLEIEPDAYSDKEMLQDLIVAATNNALENIEVMIKEEMRKSTDGLIPDIPGLNLNF